MAHQAVLVSGVRTPFMRSHRAYVELSGCDLGRLALTGLLERAALEPSKIEHVIMGTVIHDVNTPNVAREVVLASGLPSTIPAHTVSLACISANVAATTLADMIGAGRITVGICGGLDTCSDPPIRLSKKMRQTMVRFEKVKSFSAALRELFQIRGFGFRDLLPDVPKVVEYSNGKSMGEGAEILAKQIHVEREACDAYAERSHRMAIQAYEEGNYKQDVLVVHVPPKFSPLDRDEGPRSDTTREKLGYLRPAFDKQFGVCTAGNSSFLTDGASAILMMERKRAEKEGLAPQAIIRDYLYRAGDALHEMLSGPALTIPLLLARNNLSVDDIGVFEIHEAFAAQMVANLAYMAQTEFCRTRLGLPKAMGEIPLEKLNAWGGSLSIGHPFGATGGRLLWTAARRLQEEKVRYAVVSGCAAGGHGSAILLENPNFA